MCDDGILFSLAEMMRMEDQPVGEDQQAMLAEFERRRRVSEEDFFLESKEKKMCLIRLDKFMCQRMMWKSKLTYGN